MNAKEGHKRGCDWLQTLTEQAQCMPGVRFNSQCNEFEISIIVKELNIQLKIEYIFFAVKILIRAVDSKGEQKET